MEDGTTYLTNDYWYVHWDGKTVESDTFTLRRIGSVWKKTEEQTTKLTSAKVSIRIIQDVLMITGSLDVLKKTLRGALNVETIFFRDNGRMIQDVAPMGPYEEGEGA